MPLTTSPSCLMSDGLLSVVTDRIHQQQVGLGQHTRASRPARHKRTEALSARGRGGR